MLSANSLIIHEICQDERWDTKRSKRKMWKAAKSVFRPSSLRLVLCGMFTWQLLAASPFMSLEWCSVTFGEGSPHPQLQNRRKDLYMNLINIWKRRELRNIVCACCYSGKDNKKGSIMYWTVSSRWSERGASKWERWTWKSSEWCIFIVAWIIESETKKKTNGKGTKHQQNLPPWINNIFYGANRMRERAAHRKKAAAEMFLIPGQKELSHTYGSVLGCLLLLKQHCLKNHESFNTQKKLEAKKIVRKQNMLARIFN